MKAILAAEDQWIQQNPVFIIDQIKCRIIRNAMGALCGYVTVPYPLYYSHGKTKLQQLSVHGGITYSSFDDNGYRIGFDCNHATDWVPGIITNYYGEEADYRNLTFVKTNIQYLIDQILIK